MITISEIDSSTGYATGVNCLSTDTLTAGSINDVGIANGCVAVFVDNGGAAIYDMENARWTVL